MMENFANFIVDYIENNDILGKKGWINQLSGYEWSTKRGIKDHYPDGIKRSKDLWLKTQLILQPPIDDEKWLHHCNEIAVWGEMKDVPEQLAKEYRDSVIYLIRKNPGIQTDFRQLPVCSKRIAMASKIYYYADPLQWTIYDSRVAYALHQLVHIYSQKRKIDPTTLFAGLHLYLPQGKSHRGQQFFEGVSVDTKAYIKARAAFIWASHLHRKITILLNTSPTIPKPYYCVSGKQQWEIPHVEMVLFMIGKCDWVTSKGNNISY
jgi:hypothetical protein